MKAGDGCCMGRLMSCSPRPLDNAFLNDIDRLLQDETTRSEIVDGGGLPVVAETLSPGSLKNPDRLVLWKGDISHGCGLTQS